MISICIPTYNTDCTGLLKSLNNQIKSLDTIIEIIVIDDGSTLHQVSNKAACSSMGFIHIENKENLGRVASRKKLAEMSKYQYLLFIDADMIPKNETFLIKYHDFALTKAQVVFGGYAYERGGKQTFTDKNTFVFLGRIPEGKMRQNIFRFNTRIIGP